MVVHVYSCLFTWIILVQIHTGILTWNGTGIFMNIQAYSCSWNFKKVYRLSLINILYTQYLDKYEFSILLSANFGDTLHVGDWPNFAYALMLTRSRLGLLRVNFRKFITVIALAWCQKFISAEYLENKLTDLTKYCICIWYWQHLSWDCYK